MKIETWALSKIKPYKNNPRKNDDAVDGVAASLREFGWRQPIVVDGKGVIIAGHTRYKAAVKLGMTEAPCVVADDLTPEQVKAYRLADNKTGEMAGWDFPMLEEELAGIEFDMAEFGFIDHGEIDLDGLFVEHEPKEKKPHIITCPHCGETFEE